LEKKTVKTKSKQNHLVVFEPSGRRGRINEGKTILEAAQELGVDLQNVCGGQAQCGKCKVLIVEGGPGQHGIVSQIENLSPMEEGEKKFIVDHELSNGWRLACQARIGGDVMVFVPDESRTDSQIRESDRQPNHSQGTWEEDNRHQAGNQTLLHGVAPC
jgi:uncharacterized 2Fe-2S/4Fe-4S cluster protein (DUF4445 family)